jgi:hypothetical protein
MCAVNSLTVSNTGTDKLDFRWDYIMIYIAFTFLKGGGTGLKLFFFPNLLCARFSLLLYSLLLSSGTKRACTGPDSQVG